MRPTDLFFSTRFADVEGIFFSHHVFSISSQRDGRAQVADFGIARLRHSTFVETKHLNAGTVAYMSPEIMQVS